MERGHREGEKTGGARRAYNFRTAGEKCRLAEVGLQERVLRF